MTDVIATKWAILKKIDLITKIFFFFLSPGAELSVIKNTTKRIGRKIRWFLFARGEAGHSSVCEIRLMLEWISGRNFFPRNA
jgi:hypothetical protein